MIAAKDARLVSNKKKFDYVLIYLLIYNQSSTCCSIGLKTTEIYTKVIIANSW